LGAQMTEETKAKKYDPEFMKRLREAAELDRETGNLRFKGMYASTYINFGFKGSIVSVPHAHVVWFLTHGRWPDPDKVIDHIDDDPMNNAPSNLREITQPENQAKRRGRIVYRSYGTGKYGHGINVHHDRRDDRYYVSRQLSRGHGEGDLKNVKKLLGGFDTQNEAESFVKDLILKIEIHGPDYMPPHDGPRQKRRSIELMRATNRIRKLRKQGMTLQQIADETGFSPATIYNKTRDMDED
jgi:hypothetical protein